MTVQDTQDLIERAVCEPEEYPSQGNVIVDQLMRQLHDAVPARTLRAAASAVGVPLRRRNALTDVRQWVTEARRGRR